MRFRTQLEVYQRILEVIYLLLKELNEKVISGRDLCSYLFLIDRYYYIKYRLPVVDDTWILYWNGEKISSVYSYLVLIALEKTGVIFEPEVREKVIELRNKLLRTVISSDGEKYYGINHVDYTSRLIVPSEESTIKRVIQYCRQVGKNPFQYVIELTEIQKIVKEKQVTHNMFPDIITFSIEDNMSADFLNLLTTSLSQGETYVL